jgi:hypothetical protein
MAARDEGDEWFISGPSPSSMTPRSRRGGVNMDARNGGDDWFISRSSSLSMFPLIEEKRCEHGYTGWRGWLAHIPFIPFIHDPPGRGEEG